jgi:hypothetical protein
MPQSPDPFTDRPGSDTSGPSPREPGGRGNGHARPPTAGIGQSGRAEAAGAGDHPGDIRFRGDEPGDVKGALGPVDSPAADGIRILLGNPFERSYNHLVLRFLPKRETTYGTKSIEQDRAVVQTTLIVHKTDEQLPVQYRLIKKGQRWAVYDVVVDGVSLALNYRSQFDKIIRSSSYDALVQKIKSKLAQDSF